MFTFSFRALVMTALADLCGPILEVHGSDVSRGGKSRDRSPFSRYRKLAAISRDG